MGLSDLEFWAFLAVAIPGLLLPVAITWWKGRPIVPVALLSLVFCVSACNFDPVRRGIGVQF